MSTHFLLEGFERRLMETHLELTARQSWVSRFVVWVPKVAPLLIVKELVV